MTEIHFCLRLFRYAVAGNAHGGIRNSFAFFAGKAGKMKKLSVLAAIIAAALLLYSCSIFISTKSLTDSGDYPDIFDDKYDLEISRDQRGVFPEDINGAEDCDFDFQYTDTLVAADYVIFLRCKYSESDFLAEKERVSAVSVDSLDEKRSVGIYEDTENFKYPAYVLAADISLGRYHYALFDADNLEVVYVDMSNQFNSAMINFDKKYLPDYFCSDELEDTFGYNLLVGVEKK